MHIEDNIRGEKEESRAVEGIYRGIKFCINLYSIEVSPISLHILVYLSYISLVYILYISFILYIYICIIFVYINIFVIVLKENVSQVCFISSLPSSVGRARGS